MSLNQSQIHDRALFLWKNCYGDVEMHRFNQIVLAYWEKVAKPALISAENEVAYWAKSDDPVAPFIHSDMVYQSSVTAAAMCLSLQSIWERQLRNYLATCAREIEPIAKLQEKIQHDSWDKLQTLFEKLRGVPMTAFTSFHDLDLLAKLGNVCRHGEGRASKQLQVSHPGIMISMELLHRFVIAITDFWQMVKYLYNESITSKAQSLETQLIQDRQTLASAIAHFNKVVVSG